MKKKTIQDTIDFIGEQIKQDFNFIKTGKPNIINEDEGIQIEIETEPKKLSFNELKEKFDPKGLEVILRTQIGMGKPIPGLKVDFDIVKSRTSETMGVIITAEPFKGDQLGMMQSVIVEARLGSANSYFQIDEKSGHPITGCVIKFEWDHPRGSNGYSLMWAIYDFETKEWNTTQA